jgi:hypothetical protein
VTPEIAARLAAVDIRLMAEAKAYSIFTRGNCLAVAQRDQTGFSSLGSSGMMTESGLAYLVWREGRPLLVAKQNQIEADPIQIQEINKFSGDLKSALGLD